MKPPVAFSAGRAGDGFNRKERTMTDKDGRKTVTVKKDALLEVLRTNRTAHRDVFDKALTGWKRTVLETLESAYDDAKAGKRFLGIISIEQPADHTREYDCIIKMIEMSVDETVTLDSGTFACYVMDDWSWKGQFTRSTSQYIP